MRPLSYVATTVFGYWVRLALRRLTTTVRFPCCPLFNTSFRFYLCFLSSDGSYSFRSHSNLSRLRLPSLLRVITRRLIRNSIVASLSRPNVKNFLLCVVESFSLVTHLYVLVVNPHSFPRRFRDLSDLRPRGLFTYPRRQSREGGRGRRG